MRNSILILISLAFFSFKNQAQTVTDIDGNIYNTVTIGNQIWMKENLKVTHYNNGDEIPNIEDGTEWVGLSTGAYCNYQNDEDFVDTYGRLYNWFTVGDSREICPNGWSVATDAEWTILTSFLGGESIAGGKLKEAGYSHWASPNTGATNETGFTALPGGSRDNEDGLFYKLGMNDVYWTSTESNVEKAWYRYIKHDETYCVKGDYKKGDGFSIRCLKNASAEINDNSFKLKIQIFPNPATDKITIKIQDPEEYNIVIYNALGEILIQKNINEVANEIDVSALTKGVYIVEISNSNHKMCEKLFKN